NHGQDAIRRPDRRPRSADLEIARADDADPQERRRRRSYGTRSAPATAAAAGRPEGRAAGRLRQLLGGSIANGWCIPLTPTLSHKGRGGPPSRIEIPLPLWEREGTAAQQREGEG